MTSPANTAVVSLRPDSAEVRSRKVVCGSLELDELLRAPDAAVAGADDG